MKLRLLSVLVAFTTATILGCGSPSSEKSILNEVTSGGFLSGEGVWVTEENADKFKNKGNPDLFGLIPSKTPMDIEWYYPYRDEQRDEAVIRDSLSGAGKRGPIVTGGNPIGRLVITDDFSALGKDWTIFIRFNASIFPSVIYSFPPYPISPEAATHQRYLSNVAAACTPKGANIADDVNRYANAHSGRKDFILVDALNDGAVFPIAGLIASIAPIGSSNNVCEECKAHFLSSLFYQKEIHHDGKTPLSYEPITQDLSIKFEELTKCGDKNPQLEIWFYLQGNAAQFNGIELTLLHKVER